VTGPGGDLSCDLLLPFVCHAAGRYLNDIFYGEDMEPKLYVGNLPYTVTEDELRDYFAQAGTIKSVALIRDRDTGRSKGFAFVEYETNEEAQKAISLFNGTQLQERTLTVNQARPREERAPGSGGFRRDANAGNRNQRGGGSSNSNRRRSNW
jgi:RNA recognition motif-containing protein